VGKIATLSSDIEDLKLKLVAKQKLLASNPEDVQKYQTEFNKLSSELKKANLEYPALEKAAKTAASTKAKDATQKEQLRKTAEQHLKELNTKTVNVGKLLKITTSAGSELGDAIAELKKQIASKELLYKNEYAKSLKAYGDKKTGLVQAYEGAANSFKQWSADAKVKAAEAENQAQIAAKAVSPEAAHEPAAKAAQSVKEIAVILKAATEKEQELMKLFDPHRSGEKREEYEISLEDAKPFAGAFSRADNYRKAYQGYLTQIGALQEQASISARQAEVATLGVEKRLAALSVIAQSIRDSAEKAYTEMTGKLMLQGIVGRDLAKQMQGWAVKSGNPQQDQKTLTVANTRWQQVLTNEATMKSAVANLKRNVETGAKGIPDRERSSPLIKSVLATAMEWVQKADQYAVTWAEERNKGEVEYKKVVELLS